MRNPADVLKETLPAFIQRLKTMEGFCLPRQQFVHMGQLAYDCELIAVHSDRVYQGRPGQEQPGLQVQTGGIAMYAMNVYVSILRTVPTQGNNSALPSADALNRSALQSGNDGDALTKAFWSAKADNALAGICDDLYYGGVTWIGPFGGIVETQLMFSVQL